MKVNNNHAEKKPQRAKDFAKTQNYFPHLSIYIFLLHSAKTITCNLALVLPQDYTFELLTNLPFVRRLERIPQIKSKIIFTVEKNLYFGSADYDMDFFVELDFAIFQKIKTNALILIRF